MDLFDKQWASYRAVVEHDLMEHQAVAAATAAALEAWLARRPANAAAPRLVDLGCGDLALLAPLLRRLPLGCYTGLDLTPAVLPLAEAALGPVPYPTHWQEGDLLAWAMAAAATDHASAPVQIIHSAFAVHHLSDGQKTEFLTAARRRVASDGLLIWADVFREPGESLAAYRQRYSQRIRQGWGALRPEQQDQVIDHLSSFDIPAERVAIEAAAQAAGWHWHWAWQGQHRAEALAVLTPA
jgi:SAM-dependent methyltransferase